MGRHGGGGYSSVKLVIGLLLLLQLLLHHAVVIIFLCFTDDIPIIIIYHWITGRYPSSLKRIKNKISKYSLYITKTVYYEVHCGVVLGWVLKATVVWGSDPAGALCELPPKQLIFAPTLGYIGCPVVRVRHWLP